MTLDRDPHHDTWINDAGVGPAKAAWLAEGEPNERRDLAPMPWELDDSDLDVWGRVR